MKIINTSIDWDNIDIEKIIKKNKGDKMNNKTVVDEDRVFQSIMKFFGSHVNKLKDIRSEKGKWILKGDSPRGDSHILIDNNRNWLCKATNKKGDDVDFLKYDFPLLTDKGANLASIEEVVKTPDFDGSNILDENNFRNSLNTFRETVKTMPYVGDAIKAVFMKNNFWINDAGEEYYYMELSRTNKPLCRYHWGCSDYAGGEFFLTCGVPRIKEHPEADRIYFVENPFQLIFLKEIVSDPIYVKPDDSMYSLNNYLKLVDGKDIVNCRLDNNESFAMENWDFELISKKNPIAALAFFSNMKWHKGPYTP